MSPASHQVCKYHPPRQIFADCDPLDPLDVRNQANYELDVCTVVSPVSHQVCQYQTLSARLLLTVILWIMQVAINTVIPSTIHTVEGE
ncbi:hypothetical protein F4604DRAFT_1936370 [Suillus subluteus]|nr:hypothetical protein F4604DRAFT_1936370 [Suillus subluteus]